MPLLTIPDRRQAGAHDCADAALACVLAFHRIAARPRIATPPDGADPRQLENFLRRLGLRVVAGEMSVDDLGYFCRTGRPPICLVHWPGDSHSHYLIARGLSPTGSYVYFHDVDAGRGRTPVDDFAAAWHSADGRLTEVFRGWAVVGWPASAKPTV